MRNIAPEGLKSEPKIIKLKYQPGTMVYIPEMERLYYGSLENNLLLSINPNTGETLDVIKGHTESLNCIAWDPVFRTIYTATNLGFKAYNPKMNALSDLPSTCKKIYQVITTQKGFMICQLGGTKLVIVDRNGKVVFETKIKIRTEQIVCLHGVICLAQGLFVRYIYKTLLHYAAFALTAQDVKALVTGLPHLVNEEDWFGNKPKDVAIARGDPAIIAVFN